MLPESLVARIELELFSDLEGKVPFGAWQRFLIDVITERLAKLDALRAGQAGQATPSQPGDPK